MIWPEAEATEALAALARLSGLAPLEPPEGLPLPEEPMARLYAGAADRGLELRPIMVEYGDVAALIARGGPALIRAAGEQGVGWIALCPGGACLGPDLQPRPDPDLARRLRRSAEARAGAQADRVLARAALNPEARARCRQQMLDFRLKSQTLALDVLSVRAAPHRAMPGLRREGLAGKVAGALALAVVQQAILIGGWWLIGGALIGGAEVSAGLLAGWGLLLVLGALLQGWAARIQGEIGLIVGWALRERALWGVLRSEPDQLRALGVGGVIARAGEIQAVEGLGLSAAAALAVGAVQALGALPILWAGAGGAASAALFLSLLLLLPILGRRYALRRAAWTQARLDLSAEALAGMVGYRTRLAQLPPEGWHADEDRRLRRYAQASARLDQAAVELEVLLPGIWRAAGLCALLPGIWSSGGVQAAALAAGVGGVLYGQAGLASLRSGIVAASGLWISWKAAAPLIQAGSRPADPPGFLEPPPGDQPVEASGLRVQPTDRPPTLRVASLSLKAGDRALLLGPSGSGKSTLAAVLAGLRSPQAGVLRLGGLDPGVVGAAAWRRRVAFAPQFHENHLMQGTLAFNLLMGRAWPPLPADLEEAEGVCNQLGLAPLIQAMPAGLHQTVGESGWPLSHGERSRVFLARAMLQHADVWIFDESFAALDPQTLERCLRAVLDRAPTLIVVAHP